MNDLRMFMESIEWESVLNEEVDSESMDELSHSLELRPGDKNKSRSLDHSERKPQLSFDDSERLKLRIEFFEEISDEILRRLELSPRPSIDQVMRYMQKRYPERIREEDLRTLRRLIRDLKQMTAPETDASSANVEDNFGSIGVASANGQSSGVFILEPVSKCDIANCLCRCD